MRILNEKEIHLVEGGYEGPVVTKESDYSPATDGESTPILRPTNDYFFFHKFFQFWH
jgi:hypothetical protein